MENRKILTLTLKKKWFDLISDGTKREDYREIKPYWAARLLVFKDEMECDVFREMVSDMNNPTRRHADLTELMEFFGVRFEGFTHVLFKNGYSKDAPKMLIGCDGITVSKGVPEWGAESNKYYFVIKLKQLRSE